MMRSGAKAKSPRNSRVVGVRIGEEMLAAVDAVAAEMGEALHQTVGRSDAIRALIGDGLDLRKRVKKS